MTNQDLKKRLDIWVKEDLILPNFRPNILLIHRTPSEDEPDVEYWNKLRDILPELVTIHRFNKLEDARH